MLHVELGNQRQYAHHQLAGARGGVDAGVVDYLEVDALARTVAGLDAKLML